MIENTTNKFYELTSNLTSFSHAYMFAVDSIEESMPSSVRQALSAAELPKLGLHNAENDE